MNELLKLLGLLQKQGFATPEQKAALGAKVKELPEEDQAAAADAVAAAEELPESEEEAVEGVEKGIKALFKNEGARIEKSIKDDITAFLEQHKALVHAKAGVYHPDVAEKRKALNSELRDITKALLMNDDAKLKEMTTDASGSPYAGYTVDSELSAEIRHLMTEYGVARREMSTVALTKGDYKANNLVTDVTVYWVDEGAVVGSTQAVLGQEVLTLKKLGAIVTMTNELLADTEIDLMAFVASRVAEQLARAEDLAFFDGDGTAASGGFTGLLRSTAVNTVTMGATRTNFNQVTADDLLDMVDATPSGALANGKFYYHRTIKSIIRKLKDNQGAYIYQAPSAQGPATVWGYPEVLAEAFPKRTDTAVSKAFVLFGDLRQACIFGYKGGLEFARFDAGTVRNVANNADINLITTDRQAVRWTERVGYIGIVPTAVTRLRTAAS